MSHPEKSEIKMVKENQRHFKNPGKKKQDNYYKFYE